MNDLRVSLKLAPGYSENNFRLDFETTIHVKWLLFINLGSDPYGYSVYDNNGVYYAINEVAGRNDLNWIEVDSTVNYFVV